MADTIGLPQATADEETSAYQPQMCVSSHGRGFEVVILVSSRPSTRMLGRAVVAAGKGRVVVILEIATPVVTTVGRNIFLVIRSGYR